MSRYVSPAVRRLVAARAGHVCEYCLIAEEDTFFGCEVEHVISLKHGGSSEPDNLAYACAICNRLKGTDIGSLSARTNEFTRFYNPRSDRWGEHFGLLVPFIGSVTAVGEVTARILQFNNAERVLERRLLAAAARYPSQAALALIGGY